ncbi:CPBP family intramembrane glutamic endopeptidase [Streptococcus dentasini]
MLPKKKKIELAVLTIYLLCYGLHLFDYFILRTDQTFWNEAFVHKLLGIAVIYVALKFFQLTWQEIGFRQGGFLKNTWNGLLFGLVVYVLAYGVEILLLSNQGKFQGLDVYVSAYAVDKNVGRETGLIFFLICFVGNVINVIMEEGAFRGLFQKLFEQKYSFITAAVCSSILFGLWHFVGPLRSYFDGDMNFSGFILNALMLVVTSAMVGFKFALMTRLSGSLYMAMSHHFTNNFLINIIHTLSDTGADELMFVRVAIAQILSFVLVLLWYLLAAKKSRKEVSQ